MSDIKVKAHFDKVSYEFDNIYDDKGSLLNRIINRTLRKAMYERLPLTIRECHDLQNKTVLDIGCGSGRGSFLLAKEGAKVTGVDFSVNMIKLAKKYQKMLKIGKVEFKYCDFLRDFDENIKYDISIALGLFDYIKDPIPFLSKMKKLTKERMIASYPAKYTFRAPIRKIWLFTRHCPVYFYTEKDLEEIYTSIGVHEFKIIRLPTKARIATSYLITAKLP